VTHFTTREVANILELSEARVRACVRAGLVAPQKDSRGRWRFAFQDLVLLRTTKELLDARVPVPRIRRMLASLRRQLPDDEHLARVTIYADGRRIVAWDGSARWQPDSGQFLFNFDTTDVASRVPAGRVPRTRGPAQAAVPIRSAGEWFDLGLELEAYSPDEARQAYHQALELDPTLADAHVNLGRLYHEAGEHVRAEAHYRAAIAQAPEDPVPYFNLGVLLEDRGRRDEAVSAYRQAVERDPGFADAHYNLGLIYDAMGRRTETIDHLRKARRLYDRSGGRS
jgi:tetratricopeptide (TPR) repeat protein